MYLTEKNIISCLNKNRIDFNKPVLYYDWSIIRNDVLNSFEMVEDLEVQFLFPIKAFPYLPFLSKLSKFGIGFDVSRDNELKMIESVKGDKTIVSVSSPNKGGLKNLHCNNYIYTYNSLDEINAVYDYGDLSIRININSQGLKFSHFGIWDWEKFSKPEKVYCVHLHLSDEQRDVMFAKKCKLVLERVHKKFRNLRYVNIGGGWDKMEPPIFSLFIKEVCFLFGSRVTLLIEPGNMWFKNAGYLVTKVVGVNVYSNKNIIYLNSCRETHSKWSQPKWIRYKAESTTDSLVFCGSSCDENDIFALYKTSYIPQIGEIIIFSDIMPYSWTWNNKFNGIEKASLYFNE